jgi:thiosulfate dehydrogenase [quinone] large subunit
MNKEKSTYLLARLLIGMSFFGHGLVRVPKLATFSQGLVNSFSKSIIPEILVRPFSYALPVIELTIGILLLLGLFTRFSLTLGVLAMLVLIFGSSMIEQWENVFIQLVYGAYLVLLLGFIQYNAFSIDSLKNKV